MWRTIQEFPNYKISESGIVKNKKTNQNIKISKEGYVSFGKIKRAVKKLLKIVFASSDQIDEIWKKITDYPNYLISNKCRVKNAKTGQILQACNNNRCITIINNKICKSVSVKKLVRDHFPQEDDKNEIWKVITDHPNYEVSDKGRVRNKTNKRINKPDNISNGYSRYTLSKNGKPTIIRGHYLVLTTFSPDLKRNEVINHKDGNKLNNELENLEWLSKQGNAQHAIQTGLCKKYLRPVYQIDKDTNEILKVFNSASDAAKFVKVAVTMIIRVCKNNKRTCHGYKWQYINKERPGQTNEDMMTIDGEKWKRYLKSNYKVSTFGRIKNATTKCILKKTVFANRERINLIIDGKRISSIPVNRLVALTYLPNPKNLPHVDHIDKNSMNNRLNNLRWLSVKDNIRHSLAKSVDQLDLQGNFIKTWYCAKDAQIELGSSLNKSASGISSCCLGKQKTSLGFKWRFTKK